MAAPRSCTATMRSQKPAQQRQLAQTGDAVLARTLVIDGSFSKSDAMDRSTSRERRRGTDAALNERGAALLLSLFVLSTLAIVALYLGSQAQINRRIAGDDLTQ